MKKTILCTLIAGLMMPNGIAVFAADPPAAEKTDPKAKEKK